VRYHLFHDGKFPCLLCLSHDPVYRFVFEGAGLKGSQRRLTDTWQGSACGEVKRWEAGCSDQSRRRRNKDVWCRSNNLELWCRHSRVPFWVDVDDAVDKLPCGQTETCLLFANTPGFSLLTLGTTARGLHTSSRDASRRKLDLLLVHHQEGNDHPFIIARDFVWTWLRQPVNLHPIWPRPATYVGWNLEIVMDSCSIPLQNDWFAHDFTVTSTFY
jgi:hypothetical protein